MTTKRTRHVFSNDELPHLWAYQTQTSGRNSTGSFYFEDETIYSYGTHFPIARWVENDKEERAVLFTTRTYSPTTSQHVYGVRAAIPKGTKIFSVLNPVTYKEEIVRDFESDILYYLDKAAEANKRNRPKWYEEALQKRANAIEFCQFFSLPTDELPTIPEEDKVREEVKKRKDAERAEREEREQKRKLAEEKENAERLERFLSGETVYARWGATYPDGTAALRIEGEEVVTSLGARVPISHAKRGLKFVREVVANGKEYVRNGHTLHLGRYPIDKVEADGTLHAGCHVIRFAEIQRIGAELEKDVAA